MSACISPLSRTLADMRQYLRHSRTRAKRCPRTRRTRSRPPSARQLPSRLPTASHSWSVGQLVCAILTLTDLQAGSLCQLTYRAGGNVVDYMYAKAGIKYSYAVHLRDTGTVSPTQPPFAESRHPCTHKGVSVKHDICGIRQGSAEELALESLTASCNLSLPGLGFSSSSALLAEASLESVSAFGGTLHKPADCEADMLCQRS